MKKNAFKEFIITSLAAAAAGFVVKKGYEYFRDYADTSSPEERRPSKSLSAFKETQENTAKVIDAYNESSAPQKGIIATLAYTATAFMVAKLLRKII